MVNLNEMKLQKNRFSKNSKFKKLNYGNVGFLVKKEGRLELIHLFILKKLIKKLFIIRKGITFMNSNKIWFNIKPNFILQKKSKNSRMGKGKGLFERKIIRIFRGDILIQFSGFKLNKLYLVLNKLNKKFDIKLSLIYKDHQIYPL